MDSESDKRKPRPAAGSPKRRRPATLDLTAEVTTPPPPDAAGPVDTVPIDAAAPIEADMPFDMEPSVDAEPLIDTEPPEAGPAVAMAAAPMSAADSEPADPIASAAVTPGIETMQPAPAPPPSPAARSNWGSLAAAGIAGGLVALLLFYGLAVLGLAPTTDSTAADEALAAARAAQAEMATLAARPESMTAAGLADLVGRIGRLEDLVAGLAGDVDRQAGEAGPNLAALTARLNALDGRIDALPAAAGATPDLTALIARVEALERSSTRDAANARAAIAVSVAALRSAAEAGRPFRTELDLVTLPIDDATGAILDAHAERGVASRATLAEQYPAVEDAILAAAAPPADGSLVDRLIGGAGALVTIRPAGPVAGDTPVAIASRLRAAIAAGDFAAALAERNSLPEPALAASAGWAASVEARLAIDAALSRLAEAAAQTTG